MNDTKEAEIQEEIDRISKGVKSIMKKVEALYPKEQADPKDDDPEPDKAGKMNGDGET